MVRLSLCWYCLLGGVYIYIFCYQIEVESTVPFGLSFDTLSSLIFFVGRGSWGALAKIFCYVRICVSCFLEYNGLLAQYFPTKPQIGKEFTLADKDITVLINNDNADNANQQQNKKLSKKSETDAL